MSEIQALILCAISIALGFFSALLLGKAGDNGTDTEDSNDQGKSGTRGQPDRKHP